MSGVTVHKIMASSSEASIPRCRRASSAAFTAMSEVATAASAIWRERIPVRSTIQVSFVSTMVDSSSLVRIRGGANPPKELIFAFIYSTFSCEQTSRTLYSSATPWYSWSKSSLQTAIFFESLEEIYGRIYRWLSPHAKLREVSVRFRKYANANSRIRLDRDRLAVDISDVLQGAPAPIQEALAILLVSKLLRRRPDPLCVAQYQRYVNTAQIQNALQSAKRERGRKAMRPPSGAFFDLNKIFDDLNSRYFEGKLPVPIMGWSLRASRSTLGHYDPAHEAIVLSSLLDSARSSYLIVSYVLFHELLHTIYPTEPRTSRRCVHTPEFKRAERGFADYEKAMAELKKFVIGSSTS